MFPVIHRAVGIVGARRKTVRIKYSCSIFDSAPIANEWIERLATGGWILHTITMNDYRILVTMQKIEAGEKNEEVHG